ncbi:MAG: GTP-binding protein [Methylomicrobium sp.]
MDHSFRSVSLYLDHTLGLAHLQSVLQGSLDRHPSELVRIIGIVHSPEPTEAWAIQAAADRVYPSVSLPVRPDQDRRSRLILIATSGLEALTQELSVHLGSSLDQNSVRLH